jgi:hypothetical protein
MADPDLVNGLNSFLIQIVKALIELWPFWLGLFILAIIKVIKDRK